MTGGRRLRLAFRFCCAGSRIGLMLMPVASGVMSVNWMFVIAILILAHRRLPPTAAIDLPPAVAITLDPLSVPGLTPAM